MPSLLAPAKAQPGANMHEQDLFEIKRILRQCDIDPQDILAAKDKIQLVDLAHKNGIKQVPDEWSIQKIKARRQGDKQPAPPAGLMAPYPKSKPPPTKRAQLHERRRISYPSSTPKPTSPKQPAPEQPTGDGPSTAGPPRRRPRTRPRCYEPEQQAARLPRCDQVEGRFQEWK